MKNTKTFINQITVKDQNVSVLRKELKKLERTTKKFKKLFRA